MPRKRKGTLEEQKQRDRFTLLRSMQRRAWVRDPERIAVMNDPKTKRKNKSANKRLKYEHKCAMCKQWFPQKETVIDHIVPCGTFLCPADWATFGPNLWCDRSNLQKICKVCHAAKTKLERAA
jgi:5-methylcytosine-specific restriction endonuclease McrA